MVIILSTRNPSKAHQVGELFRGFPIQVISLDEAGISGEGVEDGSTLEENAYKKAAFAHAARWAGEVPTEEITKYCLERLRGVSNRSALFKTVVVLISPSGEEWVFTGEVKGKILEEALVPPQPKMPYSPLFAPDGEERCWAEMTTEEENQISHRGKAFRKVRDFLLERVGSGG